MRQKTTPKQAMCEAHIKSREEQGISFVDYASTHQLNLKIFYAASSAYHKRQQPKSNAFKKFSVKEKPELALFSCTPKMVSSRQILRFF